MLCLERIFCTIEAHSPRENIMTHAEQHRMIIELMDYQRTMGRYDLEDFDMFVKRDKDDEDLDLVSQRRLVELYEKFVPQRRRRM
jgi:hypothetical protein